MVKKSIIKDPNSWGGAWTNKKLDAFSKYVWSYLTIMKYNPYWKTIYFDGFVGSGSKKSNCNRNLYNQLSLTLEEENLYVGSAERVLTLNDNLKFNYHYFIDSNKNSLDGLKKRIEPYQCNHEHKFQFKEGNCNKYLRDLADVMKKKRTSYAALVLLDPFGMQINWDSISSLKGTRTDIWILVPTGVIVNRLLNKSGELQNIEKLVSFFGLSEAEIKDYFYKRETLLTLFGDETEIVNKVTKPITKIASLYIERLRTVWEFVSERPLILKNSKDVPIFHFVFASNNEKAMNIASQIISKK